MSFPEHPMETVLITAKRRKVEHISTSLARFNPVGPTLSEGHTLERVGAEPSKGRRGDPTFTGSREPDRPKKWLLRDSQGKGTHLGVQEGGLTGAHALSPYFVLIPEGDHFRAEHVSQWFTFRPEIRHATFSLDDAERQMNNPRLAFSANLARLKKYADEADQHTETHLMKASAADKEDGDAEADRGPKATPQRGAKEAAGADNGQEAAGEEEKPESWEHEEERADDDVDMGDEGAQEADPSPVKSDGEDERLAGIMKGAGIGSPGPSEASSMDDTASEEEEEEEDSMDKSASADLEELPGTLTGPKAGNSSRGATPELVKGSVTSATQPQRVKRKASTPLSTPPVASSKKAKVASLPSPDGPLTEAEVVSCLRRHKALTTAELTAELRVKSRSEADKKAFTGLVKKVAKLEVQNGRKVVVLK